MRNHRTSLEVAHTPIAAVILAAGRSSRMGTSKPLLPLGPMTVIERLVDSVSRAGVDDIVVVTGHKADRLTPVLSGLPVRVAHNAGYDAGMFSSVRTGAAALDDHTKAFFILPADYPLVRSQVLNRLIEASREEDCLLIHPTCCGLRGHPPLLSGRLREPLLKARNDDILRDFLQRRVSGSGVGITNNEVELEVEVEDLTILMDMDAPEDFQRIRRFAAALDATAAKTTDERQPVPATATVIATALDRADSFPVEDAEYLLQLVEAPDRVVRHCRAVAAVAETLARTLELRPPSLDVDLVRTAGLLHDMARKHPRHAVLAERLLANLGFARLGAVVGAHMVLPHEQIGLSQITEEQLVYLADKLVADDELVGLEERKKRALQKWHGDPTSPQALETIESRMRGAHLILTKLETVLGRPLEEILPRQPHPST